MSAEIGLSACVLTFEPQPLELFAPQTAPTRLTSLREKLELLAAHGIERVHVSRDRPLGLRAYLRTSSARIVRAANGADAAHVAEGETGIACGPRHRTRACQPRSASRPACLPSNLIRSNCSRRKRRRRGSRR